LILEVVDNTDNDFDAADIVDGDDVHENSIDKRDDTVVGGEHNAGDSTTNDSKRGDTFFLLLGDDLPTVVVFFFLDIYHGCNGLLFLSK
jgi:hypothetical protein